MIAVVLGGAECVHDDLATVHALLPKQLQIVYLAVNDMIVHFPGEAQGVTQHPRTKLAGWLRERALRGYPQLERIWGTSLRSGVTDVVGNQGGSSGLMAACVGIDVLGLRTVMCGVPMTVEGGHFLRRTRWNAAHGFRAKWAPHVGRLAPMLRSMSGWTAETFGRPTMEWLTWSVYTEE
jgi:hypothetical protein